MRRRLYSKRKVKEYSNSTSVESNGLADHIFYFNSGDCTQTTLIYPAENDTDVMIAAASDIQE